MGSVQTHFNASGDIYRLFSSHRPLATRGFSIRSHLRGPPLQEDAREPAQANEMDQLRALATQQQIMDADRSAPTIKIFEDQVFAV